MKQIFCTIKDYTFGFVEKGTGFMFQLQHAQDYGDQIPKQLFFIIGKVEIHEKKQEQILEQLPIAYTNIIELLSTYQVSTMDQLIGKRIKYLIQFDENNKVILVDKEYIIDQIKN